MSANSFGERFRITTFGESHGTALGVIVDGCPAGVPWNQGLLDKELERRRPGQKVNDRPVVVTDRNEPDACEILSGIYEGKTLGTPIAMMTRNQNMRSQDYTNPRFKARRGHADQVWLNKFGHADPRGGGRSSGRETVSRVMGGAVARMLLHTLAPDLKIIGFTRSMGRAELTTEEIATFLDSAKVAGFNESPADAFVARFPSLANQDQIEADLLKAKANGESFGGVAEFWILGCPAGLGQPVFRKLKADLATACMGVGAVSAFELGEGLEASSSHGTDFHIARSTEVYGGISGGISTGEKISFRVHFKPTSTILDTATKGRHDPFIVPRAIPVLEAMTALVLADHFLMRRTDR
ncbi:MAG: chorismate synthase [Bdellovibrionales bacterium]|nr:chorismate synthase [Bdellovibrionales bacterium]